MVVDVREFFRYLVVGGLNTAFSYGIYVLLLTVFPDFFSYALAYAAGVGSQYFLLSRIAFRREVSTGHFLAYPILHLWIVAFGSLVLALCTKFLGISAVSAGLVAIVCQVPVGFLMTRWWFREPDAPERARYWLRLAICMLLAGASAAFFFSALLAVLHMGFRVPLWDQFRSYNLLLSSEFPMNLLHAEAGHRPVFPNLLKLLDFWLSGGQQELLLASGVGFAIAFWMILCRKIQRSVVDLPVVQYSLILFSSVFLFWLANARMLLHGNEAVAVYWVLVWLAIGMVALPRYVHSGKGALVWLSMLMACFGFGNGAVVGCTLLVMSVIYGIHWKLLLKLIGVFAGILLLYLFAASGDSTPASSLKFQPLETLVVACRWLAGLWVQAWLGLADNTNGILRAGLVSRDSGIWLIDSADWLAGWFAEPRHMVMYWSLRIGAAGVVWLWMLSFMVWVRDGHGSMLFGREGRACLQPVVDNGEELLRLGLGLSWFGFGTALLIGLSRAEYFAVHPGQLFAERYLPWVCVFWLGLILATVGFFCRRFPCTVEVCCSIMAGVLALALWQSHLVWGGWSKEVNRRANLMTQALSQRVILEDLDHALAIPEEMDTATVLDLMLTRGASVYQFSCPSRSNAVAIEPGRFLTVNWVEGDFATQNDALRRWSGTIQPATRSALRVWIYDQTGRCVGGGLPSHHDRTSQQWLWGRRNQIEGFVQRGDSQNNGLEFQLWRGDVLLDRVVLD